MTKARANATAEAAKGDIRVGSGTNATSVLGVGTNGQVLTAASGQTTGLQWATPASGSMTSIATGTLSGATVTISSIPQTYINLYLVIKNPSSVTGSPNAKVYINGLTTIYATTSGKMGVTTLNANNTDIIAAFSSSGGNNIIAVTYYNYTASYIQNYSFVGYNVNGTFDFGWGAKTDTTTPISSLQIVIGSSTFNGGTYTLYGVN
jgi:hypothetical protein